MNNSISKHKQLGLFPDQIPDITINLTNDSFSHNNISKEIERKKLEYDYKDLLEQTDKFSRKIVSFQGNKTEILHSWVKYREGFSSDLIELLINEFNITPGKTILDPFAGSATTLIVAMLLGINSFGFEILPNCHLAWEMKSNAFEYDIEEIKTVLKLLRNSKLSITKKSFPHLTITKSAFPLQNEREILSILEWISVQRISETSKVLLKSILMSILEDVSYTRKDGQYLRWDGRAQKIIERNKKREAEGKKLIKGINKGIIPDVKSVFITKLEKIISDITELQKSPPLPSIHKLIEGNILYELPKLEGAQFDAVITSPPYANRYDYTRTYALELAFLNIGEEIFSLRQNQLSCTVENKSKYFDLEKHYSKLNKSQDFKLIIEIIKSLDVLKEINSALEKRNEMGDINNKGVLTMIEQYFGELTFVYYELFRVCKSGAKVAFVNDNVRYAGEVINVDLISTKIAETIGFIPKKIYVLPQRKGNSSQQMKKFGRKELRKSITIWEKP